MEFQVLFTFSSTFSPFPHGTISLSIRKIYLGFEGGPPIFKPSRLTWFYF